MKQIIKLICVCVLVWSRVSTSCRTNHIPKSLIVFSLAVMICSVQHQWPWLWLCYRSHCEWLLSSGNAGKTLATVCITRFNSAPRFCMPAITDFLISFVWRSARSWVCPWGMVSRPEHGVGILTIPESAPRYNSRIPTMQVLQGQTQSSGIKKTEWQTCLDKQTWRNVQLESAETGECISWIESSRMIPIQGGLCPPGGA